MAWLLARSWKPLHWKIGYKEEENRHMIDPGVWEQSEPAEMRETQNQINRLCLGMNIRQVLSLTISYPCTVGSLMEN